MTTIDLNKVPLNGGTQLPVTKALDAEGAQIVFNGQDTKTLILVENTGSTDGEIIFKKGTALQGVVDYKETVAAGKTNAFVFESGAVKASGHVFVTGAQTMKIAALLLP